MTINYAGPLIKSIQAGVRRADEFNEEDHPRDEGGRWTSVGTNGGGGTLQASGNTYGHKEDLKRAGYKWQSEERVWEKSIDKDPTPAGKSTDEYKKQVTGLKTLHPDLKITAVPGINTKGPRIGVHVGVQAVAKEKQEYESAHKWQAAQDKKAYE